MAKKQSWAEMDKSEIPLGKLRTAFEVYNRTTNKSPRTVRWYNAKLELFERFLDSNAVLADIRIPSVRPFIADLKTRDVRHAQQTIAGNQEGGLSSFTPGHRTGAQAFSSWLYEDGSTHINVLKTLKPPKIQRKVVDVLSDKGVARLLKAFDRNQPHGARNYAIVLTMRDSGLRASELCGPTLSDAHIDQGYLEGLGKGNKERLIW